MPLSPAHPQGADRPDNARTMAMARLQAGDITVAVEVAGSAGLPPDCMAVVPRHGVGALLEGNGVDVRVEPAGPHWVISIGNHGEYRYDPEHRRVKVLPPVAEPGRLRAALEGPVLMHALAHEGVHVLHASALRGRMGVVAFTAESGTGKSTLAATAHGPWQRVADDLLAVSRGANGTFEARPHLPQPKLDPASQYPVDAPARLRLDALIELVRGSRVRYTPLDPRAALELALRATVGTRAYAPTCLASHLAFCADLARQSHIGRIKVGRLEIENRPDDVTGAVEDAMKVLANSLSC